MPGPRDPALSPSVELKSVIRMSVPPMMPADPDWHTRVLKAIPALGVAIIVAAILLALSSVLRLVVSPEAILIVSALLTGTLAITVAIYVFQWNYFDKKPSESSKLLAAPPTRLV